MTIYLKSKLQNMTAH